MRIAVDGRSLAARRGVARYARELLRALGDGDDVRVVAPGRAARVAGGVVRRPRLDRLAGGADLVWAPAPTPLAVSSGLPLVVTFHDLSWARRPQDFTAYERAWHALARPRALVERATAVLAVSEATRDDLLAWGAPPEKVVVVRSGPGLGPPPRPLVTGRRGHLLAVGALEPRKAPDLLVRAHARARAAGLRAELVFAGDGRVDVRGEGVRVERAADDDRLRELYATALAVVHPAWLEGFAFPPVEGLLHGAPPIVADLPVHREVLGDGAVRFPPGDEAALADALLRVERDAGLRERVVAAGRASVARLSWERAARETRAVLGQAAGA